LWRALLRLALVDPTLIGCPIDLLRTDRLPESFSVTDACTGVGGGAWTSPSPSYAPTHDLSHWLVLRWSPQELQVIQNRLLPLNTVTTDELHTLDQHLQQYLVEGASSAMFSAPRATINVLEFATVVFFVLVAAPFLKGLVVSLGADNMATLCWMVKHRSSSGAADTLLKLLSLTCTIYNIKIVVHHVKGSVNYLSDWLSRVSGIETCDYHSLLQSNDLASDESFLPMLETHIRVDRSANRRSVARLILSHALLCTTTMSTDTILRLISALRHFQHIDWGHDPRVSRVLSSFQNLLDRGHPAPSIPLNITDAMAASVRWDNLP